MIVDFEEEFYSYDKYLADVRALSKKYYEILRYVTIGKSHDNRDIVLLKLGYGRKYLLFCSGVHGRETINTIVLMKIIEFYAVQYVNFKEQRESIKLLMKDSTFHMKKEYEQLIFTKCIYELLQTFTILFIPLLNPDGYMISLTGYEAIRDESLRTKCIRKNLDYREWKFNARGVDINRNFPSRHWKPKFPEDYAASENETKALIAVFHQFRLRGFIDVHSRGKQIFYYRSRMADLYNERQFRVAKRLKDITKYTLMPPETEVNPGDTGGNTVHYFSEHFYRLALTLETVEEDAVFPLDKKYRETTFEELKLVIFELGSMSI